MWKDDMCNQINGTDGSQFPPHTIDKVSILHVYIKNFCRKFPLQYSHDVTLFDNITAWRYKASPDLFTYTNNSANQCYCLDDECPMDGLFDASLCMDAPIYTSLPHFLHGDKQLLNRTVTGLEPNGKLHTTFVDLHPRLAFPIDSASRFQLNLKIRKGSFIQGE
jgi:scavenger receptor class B, member 1